ncbi:MAG: acyl-CoA thioesterase, partial [Clostridia bacterium]
WIEQITPVRLDFGYEVYRLADEKLLVTGVSKHVFTNLQFKPVRLPKLMPEVYEWLLSQKKGA